MQLARNTNDPPQNNPPGPKAREQARLILQTALNAALTAEAYQWFGDQLALAAIEKSNRSVDLAFGSCTERLGRHKLTLTRLQLSTLNKHIPGWGIEMLGADAIARIVVITSFTDAQQLAEQVARLLRHSDVDEQVALYRGFALFQPSDTLNDCLADGVRSNVSDVFNAVAHHNPYAFWHLDTHRFNHMVLKALFIGSDLEPIVGLDQRNNPELARLLLETARERYAESRPVPDTLWRLAAPYMNDAERREFQHRKAS